MNTIKKTNYHRKICNNVGHGNSMPHKNHALRFLSIAMHNFLELIVYG